MTPWVHSAYTAVNALDGGNCIFDLDGVGFGADPTNGRPALVTLVSFDDDAFEPRKAGPGVPKCRGQCMHPGQGRLVQLY